MIEVSRAKATVQEKAADQLSTDSITRQAIEAGAKRIEAMAGNPTYQQAWRLAARALRAMKPD